MLMLVIARAELQIAGAVAGGGVAAAEGVNGGCNADTIVGSTSSAMHRRPRHECYGRDCGSGGNHTNGGDDCGVAGGDYY